MTSRDSAAPPPRRDTLDPSFWIVTSYYNPAGYRSRRENYQHFRRRVQAPLLTVELAPPGRFELSTADADPPGAGRGQRCHVAEGTPHQSGAGPPSAGVHRVGLGGLRRHLRIGLLGRGYASGAEGPSSGPVLHAHALPASGGAALRASRGADLLHASIPRGQTAAGRRRVCSGRRVLRDRRPAGSPMGPRCGCGLEHAPRSPGEGRSLRRDDRGRGGRRLRSRGPGRAGSRHADLPLQPGARGALLPVGGGVRWHRQGGDRSRRRRHLPSVARQLARSQIQPAPRASCASSLSTRTPTSPWPSRDAGAGAPRSPIFTGRSPSSS